MSMRDCPDGTMRDLLPEFVHGRLDAVTHARVAQHVQDCDDCQDEVELLRTVASAFAVPTPDVARIVAALPTRIGVRRSPSSSAPRWMLAAGVGFLLLAGISTVLRLRGSTGDSGAQASAAGTDSVPAVQVTPPAVGRLARGESLATAGNPSRVSFGGGLEDLSEEALKTLLREIDTIDVSLSSEPEIHTTPNVSIRGGQDAR